MFPIAIIIYLPLEIVSIVFGIKFLRLNAKLYGFRNALAYVNIAIAVCSATVVLIFMAILLDAAWDIMLAIVFFKIADQIQPELE